MIITLDSTGEGGQDEAIELPSNCGIILFIVNVHSWPSCDCLDRLQYQSALCGRDLPPPPHHPAHLANWKGLVLSLSSGTSILQGIYMSKEVRGSGVFNVNKGHSKDNHVCK